MAGHGHVTPNADGTKARCGGPGVCGECSREAGVAYALRPHLDAYAAALASDESAVAAADTAIFHLQRARDAMKAGQPFSEVRYHARRAGECVEQIVGRAQVERQAPVAMPIPGPGMSRKPG